MPTLSLAVSTLKPLGDRVFVKISEAEEKTAGGIFLPDTAKEKQQVGEVVQVGSGKRNDDGSYQQLEVKVGFNKLRFLSCEVRCVSVDQVIWFL